MPLETEIKLRLPDPAKFRRSLLRLHATIVTPRTHELNLLFDTPDYSLAKRRQLLRIRIETPTRQRRATPTQRFLLTFKSPPTQSSTRQRTHKVREELELSLSDPAPLEKIFARLGLRNGFRYEKFRTTYCLPASHKWAKRLLIEIDETPIGTFAELEGPAPAIDRAAKLLGFSKSDYLLKNYLLLYRDHCRLHHLTPSHMLFSRRK